MNDEALIDKLISEISKRGYKVRKNISVKGLTGFDYCFDIIIENIKDGKRLALMYMEDISAKDVLPILACKVDTDVKHVIIAHNIDNITLSLLRKAKIDIIVTKSKTNVKEIVDKILRYLR